MASSSGPIAVSTVASTVASPPDAAKDRDEDSGLHDIRNLASSARTRLSARRVSTSPPQDEDLLASSSGGWKAVALPEPAKMVALPEISQTELKKAEKADRKSRKSGEMKVEPAARTSERSIASAADGTAISSTVSGHAPGPGSSMPSLQAATAVGAPLHLDETVGAPPKSEATVTPIIGARIAQQKKGNRGTRNALLGTMGVGLAAAAGVMIYMQVNKSDTAPAARQESASAGASDKLQAPAAPAPEKPTVQSIASESDGKDKKADSAAAVVEPIDAAKADQPEDPPKVEDPPPVIDKVPVKKPTKSPGKPVTKGKTGKTGKTIIEVDVPEPKKPPAKVDAKPKDKPKDGEPDFNDLLKEAGVDQNKAPAKPKLDKTSLTGADFKGGMAGITGAALACYKGEQGTAAVKLVIAPSGSVSRAQVVGQFAGTPVAACVEAAVRGAKFPPWDGGPQTFNYSFLLQEK